MHPDYLPKNMPPQGNDQDFSDKHGIKPFDRMDTPDGTNWKGEQRIQEAGGSEFTPESSAYPISANALLWVGISMLVLLAGLYIAMKTKH